MNGRLFDVHLSQVNKKSTVFCQSFDERRSRASMPSSIISVENLSKRYLIGHREQRGGVYSYTSMRDMLAREAHNFGRKALDVLRGRQVVQGDIIEEYWALQDVSFDVRQGEILGIIGRNGAGKSTLLKILSRITEPTSGRVTLRGRVASLLEVGTGFHPELTGRENIYMNGAILGMSRAEIRRKFDEIVAFAEVDKFLDTPVKRYSSGMYVRLAFAVAAHLEPEILIIDEVLAVGDAEFQKKCLGKMEDVSRRDGRTVLFVSHNMGAVTSLCSDVIWLERSKLSERGSALEIVTQYLTRQNTKAERIIELASRSRGQWLSDDRLRLESLEWLCELPLRHGEPAKARIRFKTRSRVPGTAVGIAFFNLDGSQLLAYNTDFQNGFRPDLPSAGEYSVEMAIGSLPLSPGLYTIGVGCRSGRSHALDAVLGCSQVEVIGSRDTPECIMETLPGVYFSSEWSWNSVPAADEIQISV